MDVGEIIKDYQIIEHIGRGGMADVWSARDSKLNRMVAVKTIAHGLSPDADPVGMFQREAQTIANLEHPNILPIYDFGEHNGSLYIVMRYVSGGSLAGWMERGQLSIEDGMRILTAMAQALDYAHARGVIHLDLKPQNILLDSNKAPYLADFGLATALDPQGRATNPGSGTLLYMAPEQLTSDVLDKRADIYSFAIMAFHILNGKLPFDGLSPMVMKQLQFQSELPDIPSLSPRVSEILRRSAALDPTNRHPTLIELVEELRTALSISSTFATLASEPIPNVAPELQEAATIYQRARMAWDGGNGRFILGVTDFLVMETTYSDTARNGLELDTFGMQMLLRGALEYGINLDTWWNQLGDSDRRWVCLHAIRSANAPARIRAMRRLEALPDDDPPRIPRLIAQALQVEVDEEARLAALHLLAVRASKRVTNTESAPSLPELTQTMTRALMTLARVETRELPPDEWLPTTYGPEVDLLIAEMALDPSQQAVSEAAARTVASIRSEAAVKYLADQHRAGRKGALRALALVRDQAPNLPNTVSPGGRFYAWAANSFRRVTAQPLGMTWRFIFAVMGAAIGRGLHLWLNYDLQVTVLEPSRIANSVAFGLVFGVFVGVVVLVSDEIPSRLRGFWKWPQRAIFAFVLGLLVGMLTWAVDAYMYRGVTDIFWDLMIFGGFGLAFGFLFNSLLHLRAWAAVALTAVSIYLPIFAAYSNYCTLAEICADSPPFSVGPTAGVGLVFGLFCGIILRLQTGNPRWKLPFELPSWTWALIAAGIGLIWAILVPMVYQLGVTNGPLSWLGVLAFALYGMLPGLAAGYAFNWLGRLGFAAASLIMFIIVLAQINPTLIAEGPFPGFDALFYARYIFAEGRYDTDQLLYTGIPFALLIAIGGHMQLIVREIREWREAKRARRRAALAALGQTEFLNRPKTVMPDTATMMEGVRQAQDELAASGVQLDAYTVRPSAIVIDKSVIDAKTENIDLDAGTVVDVRKDMLDIKTARPEDIEAEIKRLHDEDK